MSNYYILLTNYGKQVIANAHTATPIQLVSVVLGDANNQPYLPESRLGETGLVHETARVPVTRVKIVDDTTVEVTAIVASNIGGFNIHEIGIVDVTGKLVYVGNFHGGYRPLLTEGAGGDMELVFSITANNLAQVLIEVDPTVVTASKAWVNSTIIKQFTDFQALFNSWQEAVNQDLELVKSRKIEPVSIGGILITTNDYANSQEVHDGEGYGKWTKFSEGQLLLGIGSHTDKNGVTKNISMMQQLGEYEHQLTTDEMPSHSHDVNFVTGGIGGSGRPATDSASSSSANLKTNTLGSDKPHNNIQPSIGVGMWLRLPDDYTATSFDIYFTSDALGQNRVSQINEDSAIYLWIDVANATVPIAVSEFKQQGAGEFISDGANLTYPPTISNGKNLMIGVLPENYHVDMQTIIDWGFTLFDATIGKTQTIYAGLTINDTVSDAPPYNGMKFEIYIRNNNGKIKVEPKVLENNSPYIIRAGDPVTEGQQGLVMTNLPSNLQKPFSYFTVEQNPINAYSGCAMTRYSSSEGTAEFTVLTQKAFDDFAKGLIPDGTLINTVKLTYTP